jgi:hypothetical protein
MVAETIIKNSDHPVNFLLGFRILTHGFTIPSGSVEVEGSYPIDFNLLFCTDLVGGVQRPRRSDWAAAPGAGVGAGAPPPPPV